MAVAVTTFRSWAPVLGFLTSLLPATTANPGVLQSTASHDDVIKWKHFPRYWPFVREIHRFPVNSPKASDAVL